MGGWVVGDFTVADGTSLGNPGRATGLTFPLVIVADGQPLKYGMVFPLLSKQS